MVHCVPHEDVQETASGSCSVSLNWKSKFGTGVALPVRDEMMEPNQEAIVFEERSFFFFFNVSFRDYFFSKGKQTLERFSFLTCSVLCELDEYSTKFSITLCASCVFL